MEQKTLWQSPDDDVTPMVVIEASMYVDEDYKPLDQDFETLEDRQDYFERFKRGDFIGVGVIVTVSLYGVTIGEGSLWSIEHGQVSADTNADAWELSPAQFPEPNVVFMASPLSSVVVEALDVAADYLVRIDAGPAARDAVQAAQYWADPNWRYAAHVVTSEARLGDPEIAVMTQVDEVGATTVIERFPIPAGQLPGDVLHEHGWKPASEPEDTQTRGYWIQDVQRLAQP
jgi:hypothetical protein